MFWFGCVYTRNKLLEANCSWEHLESPYGGILVIVLQSKRILKKSRAQFPVNSIWRDCPPWLILPPLSNLPLLKWKILKKVIPTTYILFEQKQHITSRHFTKFKETEAGLSLLVFLLRVRATIFTWQALPTINHHPWVSVTHDSKDYQWWYVFLKHLNSKVVVTQCYSHLDKATWLWLQKEWHLHFLLSFGCCHHFWICLW